MAFIVALLLSLAPWGAPARAQTAPPPGISAEQAQRALEVLRDPQRRAEMIAVLETLARARPPAAPPARAPGAPVESGSETTPAPAPAPAPEKAPEKPAEKPAEKAALPLAPDSIGARVIVGASERLAQVSDDLVEAVQAVASLPLLGLWVVQFAGDAERQGLLLDTLWRLAVVLGAGLALEWVARRVLRSLPGRLAGRAPAPLGMPEAAAEPGGTAGERAARQSERLWRRVRRLGTWVRRVPFALATLVLDLVPVLVVVAVASVLLATGLGRQPTPRLVILAAVNAYVLFRLLVGVARMLLQPDLPRLRLVPVSDEGAAYLLGWARRAAGVGIFGYTLVEAGLLFGLYRLAHEALVKLILLVLAGFAVVMILQNRTRVAEAIRPGEGAVGLGARLRGLLAPVWHFAASFYVLALWVVVALEVRDGFARLVWLSVLTAAVLGLSRLASIMVLGGLHRMVEQAGTANGVASRVGTYQPFLRALARLVLAAATGVALLEVWGVPVVRWFLGAQLGPQVLATLASIGFTVLLAVAVWEAVNAAIERHLAQLSGSAQAVRSARLRTLLPMFRTALLVAIFIVSALIVLSEIGLNIAPLLAGAGVVGVAIGLGAQRLVQDVITGLLLLLENTMQVGDVVTLGGLSGTVENLSVRTIRLRAMDGSIHIVPFSAVTTVTNQTRDFGYAVVDVSVGLNENTDAVGEVLREVAAGMRQEGPWVSAISGDLEVLGIDRFIENAVVLRTRIRTLPAQRWAVARELNRRFKQRFDALAIESPMTSHRVLSSHTLDESSG
jgi:small-conductance mechanosensitive channel